MATSDRDRGVEEAGELLKRADEGEARSFRRCRRALNAAEGFVDSIGGFENQENWTDEDRSILVGLAKNVKRACNL